MASDDRRRMARLFDFAAPALPASSLSISAPSCLRPTPVAGLVGFDAFVGGSGSESEVDTEAESSATVLTGVGVNAGAGSAASASASAS
eukprot:CAMPEP_0182579600 /NCGR_PEP_ID=MMETSP1324-20130603/44530_1 /TAXON_ID=236786 /ORGANISM="Florenciella sp., Strain RCC1587" /LENGTH=88 /DNA_ID=CAMNT_0024795715 /DNA_START=185 /DNA_END=448 /DNA_ORIENTATION=-